MNTPIAYAIVVGDRYGSLDRTVSEQPPTRADLAADGWVWTEDRDGSRYYEAGTYRMGVHPLFTAADVSDYAR